MKLAQILKKHYLATALLVFSLILVAYASCQLYKKADEKVPGSTSTEINQPAREKKSDGELKIPETIKPTDTKDTPILTPAAATSTQTAPQEIGTPVDLAQGTFVINGKSYPVSFIAYTSVYEVMKQLNDSGKIKVDFKNYSGLGYFVDGIDGVKSDTLRGKYWIYYINGAKAQVGISTYELNSKDIITWKYEAGE